MWPLPDGSVAYCQTLTITEIASSFTNRSPP